MDQTTIGGYIARKRKARNLTQGQLADILGVSNKTISKWENGRCMPDYSVVESLCDALGVTLPELMDGHDGAPARDGAQTIDLLRRTQELERRNGALHGLVLIVLGIACGALSATVGGTDAQDFVSGVLTGLSAAVTLVGILIAGRRLLGE